MNPISMRIALLGLALFSFLPALAQTSDVETSQNSHIVTTNFEEQIDQPVEPNAKPSKQCFGQALDAHLTKILSSAHKPYLPTIDENGFIDHITFIGCPLNKLENISPNERSWLDKGDWEFRCNIVKEKVTDEMAFAMLSVDYYDTNFKNMDNFNPFFLVVIFSKTEKGWMLIHEAITPNNSKKQKVVAELEFYADQEARK